MFNGQWVRARTTKGAKQFLAEKQAERARVRADREHARATRRRFYRRVRGWFRRSR